MKKYRLSLIVLTTVMLLSLVRVGPARSLGLTEISPAALYPWRTAVFGSFIYYKNVTTAFGGTNQIKLVSFTRPLELIFEMYIYLAQPSISGVGNCGPAVNSIPTWICTPFKFNTNIELDKVSPVAVYTGNNGFKTGWVYPLISPKGIYGLTAHWENSGLFIAEERTVLLNLADSLWLDFDPTSQASLAFDSNGRPHAAVILSNDIESRLVYIHPVEDAGISCGLDETVDVQCDIIANDSGLGSPPVLKFDSADQPYIVYYDKLTDSLLLTYPEEELLANCGPEGNTWRCLVITSGNDSVNISASPDLAIGQISKYIAYTKALANSEGEYNKSLYVAKYVGSGGNCGETLWNCNYVLTLDDYAPVLFDSFSIQVDPLEYPVIAYAFSGLQNNKTIAVTYPAERGGGNSGWIQNIIDTDGYRYADLALNIDGVGIISYQNLDNTAIRIAYQDYLLFLPAIVK